MSWPHSIPADLRPRLDEVLSFRNRGAPEVWGAVRDWLELHGVEIPDGFRPEVDPAGTLQSD